MKEYNPDKAYGEEAEKNYEVVANRDLDDAQLMMVRALEGLLKPKGLYGMLITHDDKMEDGSICTYPTDLGPSYVAIRSLDVAVAMLECAIETDDFFDENFETNYEVVLRLGERFVTAAEKIDKKLGEEE